MGAFKYNIHILFFSSSNFFFFASKSLFETYFCSSTFRPKVVRKSVRSYRPNFCPNLCPGLSPKLGQAVSPPPFFHGTPSVEAAHSIECQGLDPNRRCGQAYGQGEYCTNSLGTAVSYSRGTGGILAFLVYVKKGVAPVTYHYGDTITVVNNPRDFESTYMLPLGICYRVGCAVQEKICKCSEH